MKFPRHKRQLELKTDEQAAFDRLPPWTAIRSSIPLQHFKRTDSINLLRTYLAMAAHAKKQTRQIRCSQQRIATLVGLNKRTVWTHLQRLRARGLIERLWQMPKAQHNIVVWKLLDVPTSQETDRTVWDMQALKRQPRAHTEPDP